MKVIVRKIFKRKMAFLVAILILTESGMTSLYAENWININGITPNTSTIENSNYDATHSGAIGHNSVAIGDGVKAEGDYSTAVGHNVASDGENSTSIGSRSKTEGYGSTTVGFNNKNNGLGSTTIGYGDTTTGNYNTAVGAMNNTAGKYNNVYGSSNDVKKNKSTVVGFDNVSHGYGALVLGGQNNTMYVKQYQASGKFAETGDFGVAIGAANTVLGSQSAGVGDGNMVTGTHAYSFGGATVNSGRESILIGTMSTVGHGEINLEDPGVKDDVQRVTLVGQYANSVISDSVVLGSYSLATRDSGVVGYDVATGKQLTTDEILAKNGTNTSAAELSNRMTELDSVKQELENKMWEADKLRLELQTEKYKDKNEFIQKAKEFDRLAQETEDLQYKEALKKKEVGDLIGNWQSQLAAVSVGNEETGSTRQITGVAAGTNDTDAVNVAQVKSLAEKPVMILNGGKVENGEYTSGIEDAQIALNKLAFDYGEGLKATKGTTSEGKEAVVIEIDKNIIPDKKEVVKIVDKKIEPVTNKVTQVNNKVTNVENKVTKIDNKVTKVDNKVIDVDKRVTKVDNRVTALDNTVTQVNNKVTNVENKVTKIDNKVTKVDNKVIDVDKRVTKVDNRVTALDNKVAQMDNKVRDVSNKIDKVEKRTSEGLAAVASMSVLDFNNAPVGKVGIGAGIGGYRNKQAVAVGVVYGVNENFKVNAKVGIPMNDCRNTAYGVSGTYYFNCD